MRSTCTLIVAAAIGLGIPAAGEACTISAPVSPEQMVAAADVIVRARAARYVTPPSNPKSWTNGTPDSRILFDVLETIRGRLPGAVVVLPGYLSERDDFNDHRAPSTFVRPGGRSGSCFANTYRSGGEFLLMLKKASDGDYTVNWYALGPVNEQLRSADDPWLTWVRQHAAAGMDAFPL
jgi:hypothetical protein